MNDICDTHNYQYRDAIYTIYFYMFFDKCAVGNCAYHWCAARAFIVLLRTGADLMKKHFTSSLLSRNQNYSVGSRFPDLPTAFRTKAWKMRCPIDAGK